MSWNRLERDRRHAHCPGRGAGRVGPPRAEPGRVGADASRQGSGTGLHRPGPRGQELLRRSNRGLDRGGQAVRGRVT
jgi:hypothetical protein